MMQYPSAPATASPTVVDSKPTLPSDEDYSPPPAMGALPPNSYIPFVLTKLQIGTCLTPFPVEDLQGHATTPYPQLLSHPRFRPS
ncbi:hypothetical protein TIFTF001_006756 [Ficus carica]|uniref:Uncharacterized protein n=1 Tax=Ficus carica TaxID=3494 RepID=A0AA87ZJP0_FICCA|nr:hypothetical protein TIFTF001_006756 [Ficus carica]